MALYRGSNFQILPGVWVRVCVPNNLVGEIWVLVIVVQVLSTYMIVEYLDR